jgi:rRNA-processing protein FCF1
MRLSLVLDTNAVVAYAKGSLQISELLDELREDSDLFGVPDICLAQARARGASTEGLSLLQIHDRCQVLGSPTPEILGEVAAMCDGDLVQAAVIVHAISHDAYIATTDPATYVKVSIIDEAAIIHLTSAIQ